MENKMENKIICSLASANLWIKREVNRLLKNEDGEVNLIAVVLLIIVAIALIAIFKKQITSLLESLLKKITKQANAI